MDERANSPTLIDPPAPLPFVSRRALRRVRDYLPIPDVCPYCGQPVQLVSNSAIYGREYGDWPYAYLCKPCNAYVGLHPNTDLPLGTLADRELRKCRSRSKATFHQLMKRQGWSRNEAYRWLAAEMNIPRRRCHFGMFDASQCERAEFICQSYL